MDQIEKIGALDLLNAASSALVIVDCEGNIISSNNEFKQLFNNVIDESNIADIAGCFNSNDTEELFTALRNNTHHYSIDVEHREGYNIHFSFKPVGQGLSSPLYLCSVSKEYL